MIGSFTAREVGLENKEFIKWIKEIYATKNDEIDCDQTQANLPSYVDAIVDQHPIDPIVVQKIQTHLDNCLDCKEVFEGLQFIASHEESHPAQDNSESISSTAVAAD